MPAVSDRAPPMIRRTRALYEAAFDDEMMGLDVEGGSYFSFNATGRRVWELLAEPRSLDALCAALDEEFEVEPAICRADVRALLAELEAAGLVEITHRA